MWEAVWQWSLIRLSHHLFLWAGSRHLKRWTRGTEEGTEGESYLGAQVDFEALLTHSFLAAGQGLDGFVFQAHPAHQHHEGHVGIPYPTQVRVGWSSQQAGHGERLGRQVELQLDAAAVGGQRVCGEGQPGAGERGGGAGSVRHRRSPRWRRGRRELLRGGGLGQVILHAEHRAKNLSLAVDWAPLTQHVQDQSVRGPDAGPGLPLLAWGRVPQFIPSLVSVPSFLLFQPLLQSLGVEGPGKCQSRGLPGRSAPPPVRAPPAPLGLRGARVRAARVASAATAARLRRGGVRPGLPGAVPPRPRGLGVARGAASGGPRLLGPAAAHRALLLTHRRPRPAPPLPIQPPGPPPGAGGQRGQRLGSTRGSASASGSLLRGWDSPSSLRGARAPGPRQAESPARSAPPPPSPPARPGTASGARRAARSGRRRARPSCRSGRCRGPRVPPGGAEGPGKGGGRQSRAIAGPSCGPRGTGGRRALVEGSRGLWRRRGAHREVQPERERASAAPGGEAGAGDLPLLLLHLEPSSLPLTPPPWRTPPHTYTRAQTPAHSHAHPSGCDLRAEMRSRARSSHSASTKPFRLRTK